MSLNFSLSGLVLKSLCMLACTAWMLTAQAQVQRLSYHGPNSYNTSDGQFSSTFSVAGQEVAPQGMAFNPDGTKLYVVGNNGNDISEYDLSTPYDVSTGTFVDDFSVAAQETFPRGMAFNHDGTKLYVIGSVGDDINEYNLPVAYDVSTGIFVDAFSVSAQETIPTGMAFNHDGTKLYVVGNNGNDINEYDLSTPYDVSTGTFVDDFSVAGQEVAPQGMAFNNDGTKLYVVGNNGNDISEYNLPVAYDVSTGIFVDDFSVAAQDEAPTGMAFNHDGTKLYVVGNDGNEIIEYDIDPGDYVEAAANDGSIDNMLPLVITLEGDIFQDTNTDNVLDTGTEVTIGNVPAGLVPVMTLSNSDQTVTLTFTGNATNHTNQFDVSDLTFVFDDNAFVVSAASQITNSGTVVPYSSNAGIAFSGTQNLRLSYHGPNSYNTSDGQLNNTFSVFAQEAIPTGMAFNNDGTKLYVIGRAGFDISEYDLSVAYDVSTGTFVDDFSVAVQETSPNGMAFNHDGTKLYVIGVVGLDISEYGLSMPYDVSTGMFVDIFSVAAQETLPTGMAFNHDGTKLYVIGSGGDAINEYNLPVAYDVSTGIFVDDFSVAAQETVPTGMAFNHDGTKLYVIGSGGDDINEYDLSTPYDVSTGMFVDIFSVMSETLEPNGMAFNNDGTKLYVASDIVGGASIIEYDIDPGDYVEVAANDGSLDNMLPLVITLEGDIFQDTNTDNVLDTGTEVTIGNVPAGLVPVMTLSNSDQTVTLTFTGNATNHLTVDDVSDLTFVFDDNAFAGSAASQITHSGTVVPYSSNAGIAFFGTQNPRLSYHGPNSYNTSDGQLNSTFSVSAQETSPAGMAFNHDGTKLYVIGAGGGAINEYNLSAPYEVSTGMPVDTFSVAAQGMAFNNDGTKLYVVGNNGNDINEYNLPVAYDVSTGIFVDDFSVSAQETSPTGMTFNHDGTKLYVVGIAGLAINEYNLPVAYDVSTGIFVDIFSVSAQETSPTGMAFNNDGTKLYVIGVSGGAVNEYDLSTPYDVSTGMFVDIFSVMSETFAPNGIVFNHDGTKLYVVGAIGANIIEYDIDPGDYVEAAANDGSIDNMLPLVITLEGDIFQDTDTDNVLDTGTEVTIGNVPAGLVPVMTLSNSDQTVTLTFTGNATNHTNQFDVSDLTFVFDDNAFAGSAASQITHSGTVVPYSSNAGIAFSGTQNPRLSYHGPNSYNTSDGQLNNIFSVFAQEAIPTGMAFNNDGTKLYVIGRAGFDISEYDLSVAYDVSTGTFVDDFSVAVQETSPNGMAFNHDGTKLYVIGVVGLDISEYGLSMPYDVSTGMFVDIFSVAAQETLPTGMAFNHDGTKLYVIGSGGDAINEYDLSTPYDVSTGIFVDVFSVSVQETEPTGMAFNHDGIKLYVIGSGGDAINEYDLSTPYDVSTGMFVDIFSVMSETLEPNGMAFNNDGTKLYVASDIVGGASIIEYDIDPGDYVEVAANDGSLDNMLPLVITLEGDTFRDADTDNVLDISTEVTIGSVPAGLVPVMTLSNSDQTATLTFTGNATDHTNQFDVSDLTFVFDDNAFAHNPASLIENSGNGGAFSSLTGVDFIGAPGGVANSVFWLRADAGVTISGSEVTRWQDQAGRSNFTSQVFTGATETGPAFIASDADLNNNPSLDFTNNYLAIEDYDRFPSNTDFTFISVQRTNSSSGGADRTLIGYGADEWRIKDLDGITVEVKDGDEDFGSDADITGATTLLTYKWNENGASDVASLFINGLGDGQNPLADNKATIDANLDLILGQDSDNDGTIDANENFDGELAEMILYGSLLSAAEQQRVHSYLSLKYGITLDQTTPIDYLASDGTTEMWDKDEPGASGYNQDIAGIGRDDDSGLGQVRSRSVNSNTIVEITAEGEGTNAVPAYSDIADLEFLTWGNNGAAASSAGVTDVDNTTIEARIARTWMVQKTGDVGMVSVSVDLSSMQIGSLTEGDLRLLVDGDSIFASGATAHSGTLAGSVFTVVGVNFNDGDFFSIGSTDAGNTPLPITLRSFTAQAIKGQVLIKWATATEINNDFFTLERSQDGLKFHSLVKIDGKGNSSEQINYSYTDTGPLAGLNYYRLKQTDFSGDFEYSAVIQISNLFISDHLVVFPNPASGNVFIKGVTNVLVYDALGVLQISKDLTDGFGNLDLGELAAGIYFLSITTLEGEVSTIRIKKE